MKTQEKSPVYIETVDYFLTQERFRVYSNSQEDILYTDFDYRKAKTYYKSEDYLSHTDKPKSFIDNIYFLIKKYMLFQKWKLIKTYKKDIKTAFDYGCGTGDFLQSLKKKHIRVFGFEPNALARTLSRKKGIEVEEKCNETRRVDLITLWHVLEHIKDYDNTLVQLRKMLNDDGILLIAVPNYQSYDAKHYKEYWAAYDVPRHINHFSIKGLKRVLYERGFIIEAVRPLWFDAFYISIISEKYKKSRWNIPKGIYHGGISNLKALFTSQFSSNIFIARKVENNQNLIFSSNK